MNKETKMIVYQLFPRWFTNRVANNKFNGSITENGVGKMNDIDATVLNAIKDLGVTHVWYTGVIEHANKTDYSKYGIESSNPYVVKGNAGSPYAIRDYYDVDPDIATDVNDRIQEFEALVKRTHDCGLNVIIDFVPNHVARNYKSDVKPNNVKDLGEGDDSGMFFSPNNNFFYITGEYFAPSINLGEGQNAYVEFPAKATGNDCFHAHPGVNDWYETVKLNYGVDPWNGSKHFDPIPPTWTKMADILLYWAAKGVDGFRCDMAHMVPVEFWHWAIAKVKESYPEIVFIAEIYDTNLYRDYIFNGGFDYLYDKVNLYDTLCDIVKRGSSASRITSCWHTVEGVQDHMLNFLENHDEIRVAAPQLFGNPEKAIPALVVSATISTSPFMLYAGQEMGENAEGAMGFSGDDGRTSIFDYISVPSIQRWYSDGKCNLMRLNNKERSLRAVYRKILKICNQEKAISKGLFFDLMYVNGENLDPDRQYVYLRHFGDETLLIAVNFADTDAIVNVSVPQHAIDFLGLAEGVHFMKELLSGKTQHAVVSASDKIRVDIPSHNAVIWKWLNSK